MAKNVQINVKIDTKDGVKSIGDLNVETKQVLSTIKDMEEAQSLLNEEIRKVEIGSDAYEKLKNELREVNTALNEQNAAIETLDPSQFASEIGSVASGLAATTTAAYALTDTFGLTNDSTDEFIKNIGTGMVVAQSFSAGLQGVISLQKVLKTSTLATTAATKGGTIAMRIFNGVVKANPIGLLVTALLAAITAFTIFNSSSKDAKINTEDLEKASEKLNKSYERGNDLIKERESLINSKKELSNKLEILKVQNELLDLEDKLTDIQRDDPSNVSGQIAAINNIKAKKEELIELEAERKREELDGVDELRAKQIEYNNDEITRDEARYNRMVDEYKQGNIELNDLIKLNDELEAKKERLLLKNEELNKLSDEDLRKLKEGLIEQERLNKLKELELSTGNKIASLKDDDSGDTEVETERENIELITALRNKMRDEEVLATIQHNKNLELIEADLIQDEEVRAAEIFRINVKYKKEEVDAIEKLNDSSIAVLEQQRLLDLEKYKDNTEEKKLIEEKFTNDVAQLYRDLDTKKREMDNETTKVQEENMDDSIEKMMEKISFIMDTFSGMFEVFTDYMSQLNEEASSNREQMYNEEAEAFSASLANREISQKEYDVKMKNLEQQKQQDELKAKRKAFEQEKKMNIVRAIMSGGQAVMSGIGQFGPPPSPLGIAAIIAAGVTTAAQIAVISSQKFKAARGGVVPGNGPGHIDSVDAMLAPGEMVINSNSASMYPQLLSSINEAGGGISLAPDIPTQGNTNRDVVFGGNNNSNNVVKAFVVESEMTDNQRRVSRIERSATFGGNRE